MRILGIDPGAVDTGLVVYERTFDLEGNRIGRLIESLVWSDTISRVRPPNGDEILDVPLTYLHEIAAAATTCVRELKVDTIAVEGVRRPSWRVGGKVKPLDPSAIMATSIVLGSIMGRMWTVPLIVIPTGRNGRLLPLNAYPKPLATNGKGYDKRRHERSAFDVALTAADTRR